ncbi:hypothetical protein HPG69_011876 [Diceros bicornis minor]|uniref:SCAN box domain-containing protein n=1 Tax=Diceros bicornis minor TaxID=77932 RepID=A0A7J7ERH5_DICBM|nr:hypothetical protein HPG69_011876 [Diceros bicornis minor]
MVLPGEIQALVLERQPESGEEAVHLVPATLEDVAVYLSQEEWGFLDPPQWDCSWDVLPESEGNMRGDPGRCPMFLTCLTWASLRTRVGPSAVSTVQGTRPPPPRSRVRGRPWSGAQPGPRGLWEVGGPESLRSCTCAPNAAKALVKHAPDQAPAHAPQGAALQVPGLWGGLLRPPPLEQARRVHPGEKPSLCAACVREAPQPALQPGRPPQDTLRGGPTCAQQLALQRPLQDAYGGEALHMPCLWARLLPGTDLHRHQRTHSWEKPQRVAPQHSHTGPRGSRKPPGQSLTTTHQS